MAEKTPMKRDPNKEWGRQIKSRLVLVGISQKELAKQIGVSRWRVSTLLNGAPGCIHSRERINAFIEQAEKRA